MSEVEANVAIMNGLYNNWSISNPGQDTVGVPNVNFKLNTMDPTKVHFTTRRYAYAPVRTHPFFISVRRTPQIFRPIQIGSITKYFDPYGCIIDIWVLMGPAQTIETAEVNYHAMIKEVKRIIRINS